MTVLPAASGEYTPGPYPSLPGGAVTYLPRELRKIQQSLTQIYQMIPQASARAPMTPLEGMIRLAKAPWRPVSGQTTDRWVTYVNGAWAYLSAS